MKIIRSSFVIFLCFALCIVFLPKPAHAVGEILSYDDYVKAGAVVVDLYGMANNTNLAFDPATDESALTLIQNLYTEYSTFSGDPTILAAIGAAALAAGAIAVIYDAVTGQGFIQVANTTYVESMDGFWEYNCLSATPSILRREDGTFFWNHPLPTPIYKLDTMTINDEMLQGLPLYFLAHYEPSSGSPHDQQIIYNYSPSSTDIIYGYFSRYNGNLTLVLLSSSSTINFNYRGINTSTGAEMFNNDRSRSGTAYGNYYYNVGTSYNNVTTIDNIPVYDSPNGSASPRQIFGAPENVTITTNSGTLTLLPDVPANPQIGIPPRTDPDYEPAPLIIPTNVPLPASVPDPLPAGVPSPVPGTPYPVTDPQSQKDIIDDLWHRIVTDDIEIDDPQPVPEPEPEPDPPTPDPPEEDPVMHAPLLPFLPNFNFNLSSIWHYVRDWVASLGSWFSLTFTVWSSLPYAIVVPVYATAVIVIVLGVYKRFFG